MDFSVFDFPFPPVRPVSLHSAGTPLRYDKLTDPFRGGKGYGFCGLESLSR